MLILSKRHLRRRSASAPPGHLVDEPGVGVASESVRSILIDQVDAGSSPGPRVLPTSAPNQATALPFGLAMAHVPRESKARHAVQPRTPSHDTTRS